MALRSKSEKSLTRKTSGKGVIESGGEEPIPESGPLPKTRFKNMAAMHGRFEEYQKQDEINALNRATMRDAAEGAAPFPETEVEQEGRYNLNFHDLAALHEAAKTAITDLIDSPPWLATFQMETAESLSEEEAREEKERIIAKNWSRMVRDWPEFDANWEVLSSELTGFGAFLGYFKDQVTWKFDIAGLDEFLLPRKTRAVESAVETLFIKDEMAISELWGYIEDRATAEELGWDYDAVRRLLGHVTKGAKAAKAWESCWKELQDELACNDLGGSHAETVWVVHGMVKERSGAWTHAIFPQDGSGDSYLYLKTDKYEADDKLFTIGVSSVTRANKYHAVRGILYYAYNFSQTETRLLCSSLDSTTLSMATFLTATDEDDGVGLGLELNGPIATLAQGATVVDNRSFPNLAQNALPILNQVHQKMRRNLRGYRLPPEDENESRMPGNKFGQRLNAEVAGSVSGATVNKLYRAWKRMLSEMWRRTVEIGPNNSRFPEVTQFYEDCAADGVSPDDIDLVRRVEPFRAAGNGSPEVRLMAYDELIETIGMYDEVGRKRILRDRVALRLGTDLANYYVGREGRPRFEIDEKIAILENVALRTDSSVVPEPGENDFIHAQVHMGRALRELDPMREMMASGDEPDLQYLMEGMGYIQRLMVHVKPHMEALSLDGTRREAFGQLRKMYQEISAGWNAVATYVKRFQPTEKQQIAHLNRLQQQQQAHELKMRIMFEEAQARMQIAGSESAQKQALRRNESDVKSAASILALPNRPAQ